MILFCAAAGLMVGTARATEVAVTGIFGAKAAVLVIDGGRPVTVTVGKRTPEGVKVVSVRGEEVIVEIDGEARTLRLGQRVVKSPASSTEATTVTLSADSRGHFLTPGTVNGSTVRFLVDTGASMISLGRSEAARARIDYLRQGRPSMSMTANGPVRTWVVKLNTVRVGSVTVHNVDAAVHDSELPVALLGMSFLNRMEMQRSGDTLTLRKRY
ncbi:MAG: TIGR02281 family clan AA aspartic protease [Rhodocyclaceae bacterium]|nr:TIGR02281 family clan AA aspartic protease [Rhodocyclaceae bacterium]